MKLEEGIGLHELLPFSLQTFPTLYLLLCSARLRSCDFLTLYSSIPYLIPPLLTHPRIHPSTAAPSSEP